MLDLGDKNRKNLEKFQVMCLSYFLGKSYFEDNGTQNYLVFQQAVKYFKTPRNSNGIIAWESKGLSEKY